jgi:hypothetical protein
LESATIAAQAVPGGAKEGDKGLNAGALGWVSNCESTLKGTVFGSTPYKLRHFSKTPVLVVRP